MEGGKRISKKKFFNVAPSYFAEKGELKAQTHIRNTIKVNWEESIEIYDEMN